MSSADRTLTDRFDRRVTYLRVSVTDRCNFRCVYCMPEHGIEHLARPELLTFEELELVVRVFARHGVRRVRITGGEPLVRADVVSLVERLSRIEPIEEVAMTTNAFLLARHAEALRDAGLGSLNISLDSLRRDRFERITRSGALDRVLSGIDAALAAGFDDVKLNTVVIRGFNDDEIVDLVGFAIDHDVILRFIEFMPIGPGTVWEAGADRCVTAAEIRDRLADHWELVPEPSRYGSGPARYWRVRGPGLGEAGHPVGIIAAVTECFCADCNRVRVTPRGGLRACLADDAEVDLRQAIRSATDHAAAEEAVRALIDRALYGKKERHAFDLEGEAVTSTQMTSIGG